MEAISGHLALVLQLALLSVAGAKFSLTIGQSPVLLNCLTLALSYAFPSNLTRPYVFSVVVLLHLLALPLPVPFCVHLVGNTLVGLNLWVLQVYSFPSMRILFLVSRLIECESERRPQALQGTVQQDLPTPFLWASI